MRAVEPSAGDSGARPGRADDARVLRLHGRDVGVSVAGTGPVLVCVHGLLDDSRTFDRLVPLLVATGHTVVTVDLPGHGRSDPPAGDYSLGAFASLLRDVLVTLGLSTASILGHSLGGGVALQFAYQFPERTERLVLVSSGGLGREVSAILRAAALPAADVVVPLTAGGAGRVAAALRRWLPSGTADTDQLLRGVTDLGFPERRRAFLATVRTVIDRSGQMVSAEPLLYLAAGIPTLLLWGARDRIIPAEHGQLAHASLPSSRLVVLPHAGHFPHLDDPAQVAAAVAAFLASTDPASADPDAWRARLLAGPPAAGRG